MTRRPVRLVLALLLIVGAPFIAGCSSGGGDEEAGSAGDAATAQGGAEGDEGAGGDATSAEDGGGIDTVALPEGQPISLDRSLVFTADIALEAEDVARTADRAVAIAEGAGGFAADDRRSAGDDPSADLVLRVPAPRYSASLRAVAELGHVVEQSASADDVTDQVVDLEGRTATARASVERLRGFLDRAATVQDIASLEGELARREAELESLEGRLAVLDDQVQLSTITVAIDEPAGRSAAGEDATGFVGGLRRGWDALLALTGAALVVVGAVLPFLAVALAGLAAWRLVDRRARARRVPATEHH